MRTPALKQLDSLISQLNTHFALSNFFVEQFRSTNESLLSDAKRQGELTTSAFPESVAAKRINIPLGNVAAQIEQYSVFLLSQSVARCSEGVISYFDWIEDFSRFAFGEDRNTKTDDFFDSICAQLQSAKMDLAPNECYWVFDHLRKRRNCLIHNNDDSTATFEEICRQHGTQLNRYWSQRLGHDCRVDYTCKQPSNVLPDAFIDLINCVRLATESFDAAYCEKIPILSRRDFTLKSFENKFKCERLTEARRNKKLEGFSQWLFGVPF